MITRFCPHKRPYWTNELKLLHIEQKRMRTQWIAEGRPRGSNFDSYVKYKLAKRLFAKQLRLVTENYEREQFHKMSTDMDIDARRFWQWIHRNKHKVDSYHVINYGNKCFVTPSEQANMS